MTDAVTEIENKIAACEEMATEASKAMWSEPDKHGTSRQSTNQLSISSCRSGWADALSWALRGPVKRILAKLVNSEALLEGMTTEAKRHAERVAELEAERIQWARGSLRDGEKTDAERSRRRDAEANLARAHAHHMFGVDVDGPPADRVGALHYLRAHGLPEATPADLDAACEGLETPWGSGTHGPLSDIRWVQERVRGDTITMTNTCEDCKGRPRSGEPCTRCAGSGLVTKSGDTERPGF